MTSAKVRQRRMSRRVTRAERVKPSPLAEAKKRPWQLMQLLHNGPENGGIDGHQFEAALQITEAFAAITKGLGFKPLDLERVGRGVCEMSDADARLATIWLAWAARILRTSRGKLKPGDVLLLIDAENPLSPVLVQALAGACNAWDIVREDHDRAARAQRRRVEVEPVHGVPV